MSDVDKKQVDRKQNPGAGQQGGEAPMRDADRQNPEPKPSRAGFRAPDDEPSEEVKPAGESVALIQKSDRDRTR